MYLLDEYGPALDDSVVSIGMFDGVHRGHRQVLARLRQQADRLGAPSVVLTFDPHPRCVLRPQQAPRMISPLERRLELLADTGDVDHCLVLRFDRQRSQESVERFVGETLVARLGMHALVVGENFACGKDRRGDIAHLRKLGATAGFEVLPEALIKAPHAEQPISCSSTVTRQLIQVGDMRAASVLLERPHEVPGTVTATMAVPEAVMEAMLPDDLCVPPAGAYAGEVRLHDRATRWVRSLIHISEPQPDKGRAARIQNVLPAVPGDPIWLRFVESV